MSKLKVLALVPKASGIVACVPYLLIAYDVVRDANKRKQLYFRIMLYLSISSVINRINFILTTWPMPRDFPFAYSPVGTTQTCTAAGFVFHVGMLSGNFYTATLILYYLLVVRYGWSEKRIQERAMPWCHAITFLFAFGTGAAGLGLKLFNPAGMWCWIASYPPGCKNSFKFGYTTCERGDNAFVYQLAFLYVPAYILFVLIAVSMALVYWTVREQERRISRYHNNSMSQRMLSARVGKQGVLYGGTFLVPWILSTAMRIPYWVDPSTKLPFPLVMTQLAGGSLIKPLCDFMIYFYHKFGRSASEGKGCCATHITRLFRSRRLPRDSPESNQHSPQQGRRLRRRTSFDEAVLKMTSERRKSNDASGVTEDGIIQQKPYEPAVRGSSKCSTVSTSTIDSKVLSGTTTNQVPCNGTEHNDTDLAIVHSPSESQNSQIDG